MLSAFSNGRSGIFRKIYSLFFQIPTCIFQKRRYIIGFVTGASLAQSVEQLIRNEQVIGSSPMTGSIFSSSSSILCFPFSSCAFPKNQLVGENCLRGDFLPADSGIQSGGHGGGDSGIILGYRRMRRNAVAGDLGSFRTHQGEIVRNPFPVQRKGVGGDSSGIFPPQQNRESMPLRRSFPISSM